MLFGAAAFAQDFGGLAEAARKAAAFKLQSLEERLAAQEVLLDDDAIAVRDGAAAELVRLIQLDRKRGIAWLDAAIARRVDPEVVGRLKQARAALPVLSVALGLVGEARVGKPVKLRARLRNVGERDLAVVEFREAVAPAGFYPVFRVSIVGADGREVAPSEKEGDCPVPLHGGELKTLAPGEEFDPFSNAAPPAIAGWTPEKPGRYRATLTVDYGSDDEWDWNPCGECGLEGAPGAGFDDIPKKKFAASLELDVKP